MPVLEPLGIKQVICGAISYPPDGEPLLGPSGVPNFWQLAGVQVGIADGPGLGRELARWMVHGTTSVSVRAYDAPPVSATSTAETSCPTAGSREPRTTSTATRLRCPAWSGPPGGPTARLPCTGGCTTRARCSPRSTAGSGPSGSPAAAGLPQKDLVSFRHTGWFDAVAEECRAVRERVGILDSTAFAKFDLIGPDAAAVLDRLTTNTVPCGRTHRPDVPAHGRRPASRAS